MSILTEQEIRYLESKLKRKPNPLELDMVGAEWSEHCSYKSSKKYIRLLPTNGLRVITGPGSDAGVLDVGDGYIITVHIESHNHPSAVEPYGGAATGVGGVLRDIISAGSRPIAILDALRFSPITGKDASSSKSRWLFRKIIQGIGDYGNCIGIPTVGGELEFDPSFEGYCLVDVASIGLAQRTKIISSNVESGDLIILAGGSTGRDGIHGASFASGVLEDENRSAVQVPDPFLEKLLIEATIETAEAGLIKTMKDLGGGGLSCCLSETSDYLRKGLEIELTNIHLKDRDMSPPEIMISESQERMLYITDYFRFEKLKSIFEKYEVPYSVIGKVKNHQNVVVKLKEKVIASLPSNIFAHAPLIDREMKRPDYLDKLKKRLELRIETTDLNKAMLQMLSNPTLANKRWVYQQYDHEVGLRTVSKPGHADASVLRLGNGKFISVKLDGNSKHCYLDPYQGTLGCLSEACRNIVCTGATPIAIVDHLQFARPDDPQVFWTFVQSINAIRDFCEFMNLPVVGGKVSFYNETSKGAIKPSPVIGSIGLNETDSYLVESSLRDQDSIFIIGTTADEMGGSEYYEYCHQFVGGVVPKLDLEVDRLNSDAILQLIKAGLADCVHDCSKGGLGIALCEMAVQGQVGVNVNINGFSNSCSRLENILFSESHSRYIVGTRDATNMKRTLSNIKGLSFSEIGSASKDNNHIYFHRNEEKVVNITMSDMIDKYYILDKIMGNNT
jgi:phosphoribosylformylglycinamidine synthase subunit PurL